MSIPQAGSALARAFIDDPAVVWALPKKEGRDRQLEWLFPRNVAAAVRRGGWFTVEKNDAGAPLGAAVWLEGPSPYVSLGDELACGLWSVPFTLGSRAALRFLTMTSHWAAWRKRTLTEQQPHIYLALVGVVPEARGRGLSRTLLASGFARADERGWPVALETHLESNVSLYRKFGFELLSDEPVAPSGPRCFKMLRRPPVVKN
jgi:GNAT superfamily N-acetyltransferase